MIATRGTPRVLLVDGNANNRQELLLRHEHEGLDLQLEWAGAVLGNLAALWGRAIHLDTVVENKRMTLTHDGTVLRQVKRAEGK
jgi:stage V sporulation protein R